MGSDDGGCVCGVNQIYACGKDGRDCAGISGFVRGIEPLCDGVGYSLCAAVAMGRQPERKCIRDLYRALRVCHLATILGTSMAGAGVRERCCSIAGSDWGKLDDGSVVETKQEVARVV